MKRLNVFLSASPAWPLKNFNSPSSCAAMSMASILPRNRARQYLDMDEEVGTRGDPSRVVEREPSTRYDHVHVRMMGERRAPGVKHGGDADAVRRGAWDRQRWRAWSRPPPSSADCRPRACSDRRCHPAGSAGCRRRENTAPVTARLRGRRAIWRDRRGLALRAMPVAAAVVTDLGMTARRVLAARDMAAERRCTTALDRTHHLQLVEAHMPAVGLTPAGTVVAENVRDLQNWSSHGPAALWRRRLRTVSLRTPATRRAQTLQRALDPGNQSDRHRDCSGLSSRAWNVRATLESRGGPRHARADGSQNCGEANAARSSCAAPRLWRPP